MLCLVSKEAEEEVVVVEEVMVVVEVVVVVVEAVGSHAVLVWHSGVVWGWPQIFPHHSLFSSVLPGLI